MARLPTSHWLAEVVRMRVVQCWRWWHSSDTQTSGQESTRKGPKSFCGKISCASGTARDAQRIRGRTGDGGRTLKTACLGVVLNSQFSVY